MNIIEIASLISLGLISLAFVFMLIRLIIGPSLEDRVVSLDLFTTTIIAFIAIYAIYTQKTTILDVGIIIGLVAFIGSVAFGYYLERRSKK